MGCVQQQDKVWQIRQSKRGVIVRVPETNRLRIALSKAKRAAQHKSTENIGGLLVCPT
jgi:hypothetical protein